MPNYLIIKIIKCRYVFIIIKKIIKELNQFMIKFLSRSLFCIITVIFTSDLVQHSSINSSQESRWCDLLIHLIILMQSCGARAQVVVRTQPRGYLYSRFQYSYVNLTISSRFNYRWQFANTYRLLYVKYTNMRKK